MKPQKGKTFPSLPADEQELSTAIQNLKFVLERLASITKYMGHSEGIGIRSLKIGEHYYPTDGGRYNLTSKILLCGHWLQKLGFEYGERVKILTMPGIAVIVPLTTDEPMADKQS